MRVRRVLSVVALVAWGIGWVVPAVPAGAAPANDDEAGAVAVGALPYAGELDTTGATLAPGEGVPCAPVGATVWFTVAVSSYTPLVVSTAGSDFDTVAAVYGPGATSPLACSDDAHRQTAILSVSLFSPGTYRIQAGGYAGATGTLRLSVSTGEEIRVKVLDPTGAPVTNACASRLETEGDVQPSGYSTSGSGVPGEISVRNVPPGAARVQVRPCGFGGGPVAPDWVATTTGWIDAHPGVVPTAVVTVARGGRVTGTVVDDATGLPVAGAQVSLTGGGSATTGSNGAFTIANVAPGSYGLVVNATGYVIETFDDVLGYGTGTPVEVAAGQTTDLAAIGVTRTGAVAGTVSVPPGTADGPVCVQAVHAGGVFAAQTATDATGAYTL